MYTYIYIYIYYVYIYIYIHIKYIYIYHVQYILKVTSKKKTFLSRSHKIWIQVTLPPFDYIDFWGHASNSSSQRLRCKKSQKDDIIMWLLPWYDWLIFVPCLIGVMPNQIMSIPNWWMWVTHGKTIKNTILNQAFWNALHHLSMVDCLSQMNLSPAPPLCHEVFDPGRQSALLPWGWRFPQSLEMLRKITYQIIYG